MSELEIPLSALREIGWSFWDPLELRESRDSVEAVGRCLYEISKSRIGLEPSTRLEAAARLTASELKLLL